MSGASLSFGTPATGTSTGFSLGGVKPTGGFSFSGTGGSILGGSTLTTASTGALSVGQKMATTAATGFPLGGTTTVKPGGLFGAAVSTPTTGGLTYLGSATSSGHTLGTTAAPGVSFGLGVSTPATVGKGLGGIDPLTLATSSAAVTTGTVSSGTSDNKIIKETSIHPEIMATVTSFKNYVKKQKAIREEITRFSVKPYHRVYKEMVALKQLLAVVSNGLQRNAVAIHKLKLDSAQELKNTEIAHRTNEIPPALQLENYAPTEYFQRLMEQFEEQMHLCRQQIEQMESLMASLTQPNMYTPQELTTVMVRLNETFIALAAQLQLVHESVRVQKEQYLNYHRVYHGITENIFLVHKKASEHGRRVGTLPTGPGAFDNVSNAASIAVAAALQSAQRPTGIQGAGLTGQFTTGGLGTASTLGSGGFGVGGFGSTGFGGATSTVGLGTGGIGSTGGLGIGGSFGTQLGGVQGSLAPMGSTTGFGMGLNTVAPTPFGFGVSKPTGTAASFGGSLSAGPTAGSTGFGFGTGGSSSFASTTTTGKPLQLQKPPSKFRKGVR